jgi:hypothetical protein
MSVLDYTDEVEFTDEEVDAYVQVALANGFSKGTANVSAADMKKLRPILRKYAKNPHPFRACVKDNRKRFGPATEKFCAVLKDLIKGTTKWRGTDRKKNLSETTLSELFGLDVDETFMNILEEITEEELNEMVAEPHETTFSDEPQLIAEMYLADEQEAVLEEDGYLWKPVIREGLWKFSPGPGQKPIDKPITVVPTGVSDREKLIISIDELRQNFEEGAKEHVTIPTSHADTVLENTGFVKKVRISKDDKGRTVLEAGMDFTEPEVKEKAIRGTIANTSAGILFDYIHKESGKRFNAVLGHAALTNHPWLNGMKPFGVNASDNVEVIGFSDVETETTDNPAHVGGGEVMSETTFDFSELGFASVEELKTHLAENASLREERRVAKIEDQAKAWQEEGKTPALVVEAKNILMSDKSGAKLNLSENGKETELTASDIVERLVNASPSVKLSEDVVKDETTSEGGKPVEKDEEVELSQEVKALASHIYFYENKSEEDSIKEAQRRLAAQSSENGKN